MNAPLIPVLHTVSLYKTVWILLVTHQNSAPLPLSCWRVGVRRFKKPNFEVPLEILDRVAVEFNRQFS